jgi:histidinol-phosphate aminotransferase
VYSQHAFMVYPLVIQAIGAQHIEVRRRGLRNDLEAMAPPCAPTPAWCSSPNPNNPTGTFSSWEDIAAFIERVPPNVLVVLDEAYGEYLPDALVSPTPQWLERFPNLVVSRTLSKAFGLADCASATGSRIRASRR